MTDQRYLGIYLNDHLAGATAGQARFARAATAHDGTPTGEVLRRLHGEVVQDRLALMECMDRLGVPRRLSLQAAGRATEAVGSLKPNGHVVRRSPLRLVVELEGLMLGVEGKAAMWRSLRELARTDDRLDPEVLEESVRRAGRQSAELEHLRRAAVVDVLSHQPGT